MCLLVFNFGLELTTYAFLVEMGSAWTSDEWHMAYYDSTYRIQQMSFEL
jgi:hypothetical protein